MNNNPYIKTNWRDHIVDIETGQVIQEGTRFTASRANNMEDGIFNAYEYLKLYSDEITKLRIQLEMIGRAPVNNGTFFDPIDGEGNTKALKIYSQSAISQNALGIGETEITVDDSSVFAVGQEISILDGVSIEHKVIQNIVGSNLVVTELVNSYKKGAMIIRSNTRVRNNKLDFGSWGNYSISVMEVI